MKTILIIGGGAAGIAAALSASRAAPNARITILEGLDRVGKKILATGNGHCNLSNEGISPDAYHTQQSDRLKQMLSHMPVSMATDFFRELGLLCTTDNMGRIYPYCRQASMVLDILLLGLKRSGINPVCNCKVTEVTFRKNLFSVKTESGKVYQGDAVILTTGGKAAPKQGSNGSGYALAAKFGHHCTALYPCLVPLQCKSPVFKGLKGIRVHCTSSLLKGRTKVASEYGELQFTDYGLSGIPAFQLSCHLHSGAYTVGIDFFPQWSYHELRQLLQERVHQHPSEPLETVFLGLIHKRLLFAVLKTLAIEPISRSANTLSRQDLDHLASALKQWCFPVTGTLSWEQAQVTGGGIPLNEIDGSFSSVYRPGFYLAGEILDVTGDCGGYNLHWAWCSGITAGKAAAAYIAR